MKKALRIIGYLLLAVVLLALGGAAYIRFFKPDVGKAPDLHIAATPDRIERGCYLANGVAGCMDCHSKRDWTQYAGPMVPGTEGSGGEVFTKELGFPGTFYSRNITPTHLKEWTDGEVYRAITAGVSKDGEPLFPLMPYTYYGQLDTEDVYSIIAYVRTLKPIENKVPASTPDFPVSLIMRTFPQKASPGKRPLPDDTVAYGRYLVTAAGCAECHTPAENGQIVKGKEFTGGREFIMPAGTLRSANITPDETGIGSWSREQFILKFKQYLSPDYQSPAVSKTDFNTLMPWKLYASMTESDLSSIYHYLKTLPPVSNAVTRFTPAVAAVN